MRRRGLHRQSAHPGRGQWAQFLGADSELMGEAASCLPDLVNAAGPSAQNTFPFPFHLVNFRSSFTSLPNHHLL